jgi:hypothetical protein
MYSLLDELSVDAALAMEWSGPRERQTQGVGHGERETADCDSGGANASVVRCGAWETRETHSYSWRICDNCNLAPSLVEVSILANFENKTKRILNSQFRGRAMVGATAAPFGKGTVDAKAATSRAAAARKRLPATAASSPVAGAKGAAGAKKVNSSAAAAKVLAGSGGGRAIAKATASVTTNPAAGANESPTAPNAALANEPPALESTPSDAPATADGGESAERERLLPEGVPTVNMSRRTLDALDVEQLGLELAASDDSVVVRELNLLSTSLGAEGARVLSKALASNRSLLDLDLGRNDLGDAGAAALATALAKNAALLTLYLGGNAIGPAGAASLSAALEANSTLSKLELGSNAIGDKGAQSLAEVLAKKNVTLRFLGLGFNSIADTGADALAAALKSNATLTTLNLQVGFKAKGAAGNASLRAIEAKLKRNERSGAEGDGGGSGDGGGGGSLFAMAAAGVAQEEDDEAAGESGDDDVVEEAAPAAPRARIRRQW